MESSGKKITFKLCVCVCVCVCVRACVLLILLRQALLSLGYCLVGTFQTIPNLWGRLLSPQAGDKLNVTNTDNRGTGEDEKEDKLMKKKQE
jgi:hypothetical protein